MKVGSITLGLYGPSLSEDNSPAGKGLPSVTITGEGERLRVDELRELGRNWRARRTYAGIPGIQRYIDFECDSLDSWDGWYIITGVSVSTDGLHIDAAESDEIELGHGEQSLVPFSIKASYAGDEL